MNLERAVGVGEDLPTAQVYGTAVRISTLLERADDLVAAGTTAPLAQLEEVTRLLAAMNSGQVTYVSLPTNNTGDQDPDGDGRFADLDNCPLAANADQADSDRNGIGDACEPTPFVNCVARRRAGEFTAYFGYANEHADRRIAVGVRNRVTPGPADQGQPQFQVFGGEPIAVAIPFTDTVTWELAGHSATATPDSPRCSGLQVTHLDFADNVVLYADGGLRIGDGVRIVGWSTVANAGRCRRTVIGSHASVGDVVSTADVVVEALARVNGSVQTAGDLERHRRATILGRVEESADVAIPSLDWEVDFPPEHAGDVEWQPDDPEMVLEPGSYGDVDIRPGTTLVLSSGEYYFESLRVRACGELALDQANGPVVVYVRHFFDYKGRTVVQQDEPAELLIGYFGFHTAELEKPFLGAVIAPNAKLTLGSKSEGAYDWDDHEGQDDDDCDCDRRCLHGADDHDGSHHCGSDGWADGNSRGGCDCWGDADDDDQHCGSRGWGDDSSHGSSCQHGDDDDGASQCDPSWYEQQTYQGSFYAKSIRVRPETEISLGPVQPAPENGDGTVPPGDSTGHHGPGSPVFHPRRPRPAPHCALAARHSSGGAAAWLVAALGFTLARRIRRRGANCECRA
jgi:hypothetical protein